MNLFEMVKQLKSLQKTAKKLREELKKELVEFEDENCKIVANAAGEVVSVKIKTRSVEEAERSLNEGFKKINGLVKEKMKEKLGKSLLGGLELF